jgi:hypothetical protein
MFDAAHDDGWRPQTPPDPMIAVAERHLRLLAEVAELAMAAARAASALAVASAEAAANIVAEKDGAWACEMDKARAVHASRDAADAFTRISRALRLTLALETATAERLRDLRAGVTPARIDRANDRAAQLGAPLDPVGEKVLELVADAIADDGDIAPVLDLAHDLRERLTESDRFGPLLKRPLLEVVAGICADIGATPDWTRWGDTDSPTDGRNFRSDGPALPRRGPRHVEASRPRALEGSADPPPDPRPPTPHPRE